MAMMFDTWVAFAEEVKHSRVVVARCLAKIKNRAAAAAFLQWHELTETVKAQRVAVGRALMRMKQRVVLECWDNWTSAVFHSHEADAMQKLAEYEARRQEDILKK